MSVAAQLELDYPDRGLLAQARTGWALWCGSDPRLGVVDELLDLPEWILSAERGDVDAVLHKLARLGSPTGGNDVAAAGALAWLLLPGAVGVAHRLRDLTPRIDEYVAAQLWIEVRSFAWERRRKVAANIVMDLRRGVLRELGATPVRESDRTWARAMPLPPEAHAWRVLEARAAQSQVVGPEEEITELLSWATAHRVINERDRQLLVGLAEAACQLGVTHNRAGRGGLCSRSATRVVGAQHGISAATVRRRALRSARALAEAYAQQMSA